MASKVDISTPSKAHYISDLARLDRSKAPAHVHTIRSQGIAAFQTTDYPNTRMEEWRHTNIAPIVNTPYTSLVDPASHALSAADVAPFLYGNGDWTELLFVDGYFAPDLSHAAGLPKHAYAGSLWDALLHENLMADRYLNKYLGPRNAFTHLNSAFLQDGAFVYIPKNKTVDAPIHLVFVTSNRRVPNTAAHLRTLIVADSGVELNLVESHVSLAGDTPYLNNAVVELALESNAAVTWHKIVQDGPAGNHLATTEVHQARDSRFTAFTMSLEGHIVRNQLCVALDGEGAECGLHGLVMNDGERLTDNAVNITHLKSNCTSRVAYKGILDGKSKGVFLGKVHVHRDAQKTDSNQLSNYMLLSNQATIDTKPQLEIYADDVKCTHGATVGAPPEPIIFYFRSRGIGEPTARAMLTYGFADEVVSEIGLVPVRERLDRYVYRKYSPKP